MRATLNPNKKARHAAATSYSQRHGDPALEAFVAYAAEVCEAPVSLVSAVDEDHLWFQAAVGADVGETPRDVAFCAHVILQDGIFEVPDTTEDARFRDDALVTGPPYIRFYAGVPIRDPIGLPLGSFCVTDTKPRRLNDFQRQTLVLLANQTEVRLEQLRKEKELAERTAKLEGERERLLAMLQTEREKLQTLIKISPAAIAVIQGEELVVEYANDAYLALVGREAVVGKTLYEALPDVEGQVFVEPLLEVIASGKPFYRPEVPIDLHLKPNKQTATSYVNLLYSPMPGADGHAEAVFVHAVDITDVVVTRTEVQRLAEELAKQTALWNSALTSISDLVWVFGPDLRFEYANRAFLQLYGLPIEEIVGRSTEEMRYPPEVTRQLREEVNRIFADGGEVSNGATFTNKMGVSSYFDYYLSPIFGLDGKVEAVAGSARDVSERNAVMDALRASEERFRAAQATTPDPFTILEAVRDASGEVVDFRWTYVNAATERLTGESAGELIGALVSVKRLGIRDSDLYKGWLETLVTGEPFSREVPMQFPSGLAFVRLTGVRIGDGIGTWFTDLTRRQRTEEGLQAEVKLQTAEIQAALKEAEAFNYSISHDLRSPLRTIAWTSSMLLEEAGELLNEEHRALLERQHVNAKKLGQLIDELLRLSRFGRAEVIRQPLDITRKVRGLVDVLGLSCEVEIQEGMVANGDAALVRTVLQNLLDNASKFSPAGTRVSVGEKDGVFFVRDEGVGFDMQFAAKIFLPFERLVADSEFPGTGIGLANVDRIVKRHGGRVWVESEPGRGTTFFFTVG